MTLHNSLKTLLTLALALPIVYCVLIWVRGLVISMGDPAGAAFIGHVETACLAVWSISLVGLILVLAVVVLLEHPPDDNTNA